MPEFNLGMHAEIWSMEKSMKKLWKPADGSFAVSSYASLLNNLIFAVFFTERRKRYMLTMLQRVGDVDTRFS